MWLCRFPRISYEERLLLRVFDTGSSAGTNSNEASDSEGYDIGTREFRLCFLLSVVCLYIAGVWGGIDSG